MRVWAPSVRFPGLPVPWSCRSRGTVALLPLCSASYLEVFKYIPAEKTINHQHRHLSQSLLVSSRTHQTHHRLLHQHFSSHPKSDFLQTSRRLRQQVFRDTVIRSMCEVASSVRKYLICLVFLQLDWIRIHFRAILEVSLKSLFKIQVLFSVH